MTVTRPQTLPWFDVRRFGARGNGTNDDTAAIQAAIAAAGPGGTVLFPNPAASYVVSSPLVPLDGQRWVGPGWRNPSGSTPCLKAAPGFDAPIVDATGTLSYWTCEGLSFRGTANAGSKAVYIGTAQFCQMRDCIFDVFGDQAVHVAGGQGGVYERLTIQNALMVTTGRTDWVGAFDHAANDSRVCYVEATVLPVWADGWRAAIVIRGSAAFFSDLVGETSEAGIVTTGTACLNHYANCRADINKGHGFVFEGPDTPSNTRQGNNHQVDNCLSYRNGQQADNTYDGFVVRAYGCQFSNNLVRVYAVDANRTRHAFTDDNNFAADKPNRYVDNMPDGIAGLPYNATGSVKPAIAGHVARDYQLGQSGNWNTGHATIGSWHLWVDSSNRLRVKATAPQYETDGAAVGAQADVAVAASEAFNVADGTLITALANPWTKHATGSFDATAPVVHNNRVHNENAASVSMYYRNDFAPASADYRVEADFVVRSDTNASLAALCIRLATGADTCYLLVYNTNGNAWGLYKRVAGVQTQLGSIVVQNLTVDQAYRAILEARGTAINAVVDGTSIVSVTDSAISAAGRAGIRLQNAATSTTGVHLDNWQAVQ